VSPLLCIGIILATFRASGYIPSAMKLLKMVVKTRATVHFLSFHERNFVVNVRGATWCETKP